MRGLLDLELDSPEVAVGAELPLGWHWLYFREPLRRSALGADGHEARGAFMPDTGLPRRMWAGGRLRSRRPVIVGRPAELRSQVTDATEKHGKSGRLLFATVSHVVRQNRLVCVEEKQTIVYREAGGDSTRQAGGGSTTTEPASSDTRNALAWQETFHPDAVTLFRFSALTYNAHRIHYDRAYARTEGYPDLLVHAPLTALALLNAAAHNWQAEVREFDYRALSPLFVDQTVQLVGHDACAGHDVCAGHDASAATDAGVGAHTPTRSRSVTAWAPGNRPIMRGRIRLR